MTDVFDLYLKSKATKKTYRNTWNKLFLKHIGITEKKLFGMSPKQQEQKIIDYVSFLKEENLAPTTIRLRLAVMEFVFSMNDIMLNWKKLRKMIPEKVKPSGAETWTDQEIREMIKCAESIRNRTLVYYFKDVGSRIGAVVALKIKDIEYFEDCACITIYSGFPEEYPSFLTPESTKMLKHYLKSREDKGEILTPESAVFGSEQRINLDYTKQGRKAITVDSVSTSLLRIFSKFPNSRTKQSKYRYNIQLSHGFRKWQATKLKLKIDVHHSISERLLGHKAGLDSNYFVTNNKEAKLQLFEAFKKCIPDLTLDKSEIIENVENYRKQLDKVRKQRDELLESMKKLGLGIGQDHYFDYNPSDSSVITAKSQESD